VSFVLECGRLLPVAHLSRVAGWRELPLVYVRRNDHATPSLYLLRRSRPYASRCAWVPLGTPSHSRPLPCTPSTCLSCRLSNRLAGLRSFARCPLTLMPMQTIAESTPRSTLPSSYGGVLSPTRIYLKSTPFCRRVPEP